MDDRLPGPNRDLLHERPDERLRLGDLALHQELAHLPRVGGNALDILHTGPAQGEDGARLVGRLLKTLLVLQVMPDAREYLLGGEVRLLDQLPEAVHAPADVGKFGVCCLHPLLLLPDDGVHLLVDHLDEVAHVGLGEDVLSDLVDDEAFEALGVEPWGHALAAAALEEGVADVVGVASALGLSGGECLAAGLTGEDAAEEVGTCGAAWMGDLRSLGLEQPLHLLELPLGDDGGEGILDADGRSVVLGAGSPHKRSGIGLVAEYAVDGGLEPLLAARARDALAVEHLGNLQRAVALKGHAEDAPDYGIGRRVEPQDGALLHAVLDMDLPVSIWGVGVHPEAARGSFAHAPDNLLRKVLGVELVHALDDGLHELAGGGVVGVLGDGDDADALLAEHGLEGDRVFALPGEA